MRFVKFLLLAAIVVLPSAARAEVRYRVTNMNEVWAEELTERYVGLGMDRPEAEFQAAQEAAGISMHGINNNGQMTGSYREDASDLPRAISWSPELGLQDLGLTGNGRAINDSGMIVGTWLSDEGEAYPFVWEAASGIQTLELPPGQGGYGVAVNNQGNFTGLLSGLPPCDDAFMAENTTSGYDRIGEGKAMVYAGVLAINDAGQVVGTRFSDLNFPVSDQLILPGTQAYIWDSNNGLCDLPQGDFGISYANDINNVGVVVGSVNNKMPCIWENEQIRLLDGFEEKFPEANSSTARFINELGMVVGTFIQPTSPTPQSSVFIWEPDGGVWDVNELLPEADKILNHPVIQLRGLTNDGDILLSFFNNDYTAETTLLLRSVPEPSCVVSILVLMMTLGCSFSTRRANGTR